jgi:hypothetical protein
MKASTMPAPGARTWRCHACRALLGIEHDGELHVRCGKSELWIRGDCRQVCRRCGAVSSHTRGAR